MRTRSSVAVFLASLLFTAVLFLAITGRQTTAAAAVSTQQSLDLTNHIAYEHSNLLYWIRVATGENVPCAEPCNRETSFDNIIKSLMEQCGKMIPPAELLKHKELYDSSKADHRIRQLDAACTALDNGKPKSGPAVDSPAWRAIAEQAKQLLQR